MKVVRSPQRRAEGDRPARRRRSSFKFPFDRQTSPTSHRCVRYAADTTKPRIGRYHRNPGLFRYAVQPSERATPSVVKNEGTRVA